MRIGGAMRANFISGFAFNFDMQTYPTFLNSWSRAVSSSAPWRLDGRMPRSAPFPMPVNRELSLMEGKMSLRLHAISWEADRILRFELRHPAGDTLPPVSPGDHVVINLASGIARSYSLLEASARPSS